MLSGNVMLQDQTASGVTTPTSMLVAVDDGLRIPIDQPVVVIGRSKRRAHYQIKDPQVSSVHCEIHARDGKLHVRDCSRHGTRINGRKVDESELLEGDILQFVKHRFRVETGVTGPHRDKEKSRHQDSGPTARDSWYVRMAGIELGPMPWSDLADMTRNHEVTRADEVRQEFESEWKSAGSVCSLFPDTEDSAAVIREDEDGSEPAPAVYSTPEGESAEEVIDLDDDLSSFVLGDDGILDHPAPVDYKPDPDNPRYFMRRKGRESGPLEFEKLQALAVEGRLSELDSIRTDANPDWVSAATVKDLFIEGGSRDLSDEAYAASLLSETDQKDSRTGSDVPDPLIPERDATSPVPETDSTSLDDPGTSLPPLPVPAARDGSRRTMAGDALAPLIYLKTWPAMAVCIVLVAMLLSSLIPSFEASVVRGRVTLDDQPLKDSSITFTDMSAGIEANGLIDEDGTFVVTTMGGGMSPGTYIVTFAPVKPEPEAVIEQLQRQYLNGQAPGGAQEQDLNAEEPASLPPGTIPMKYRASNTSGLSVDVVDGRNEFPFDLTSK